MLNKMIDKFITPSFVIPLTDNLNNNVYFDLNGGGAIFQNITGFIAKEFTKSKIVLDGVPNQQRLDYMLNLSPNPDQSANELLYTFAEGMLKNGYVWYKIEGSVKAPEKLYISLTQQSGYKQYTQKHLRLKLPTRLNEQYTDLINTLSTQKQTSRLHLKTKLRFQDENFDPEARKRLQLLLKQAETAGGFVTSPNEDISTVPMDVVQPKSEALADLKTLIYEHLNLSPEILSGQYNETQYRAFYSTQLKPVSMAFEEFLNVNFVTYDSYIGGVKIEVILDLLQFANLESFTSMARQGIYNTFFSPDEARKQIGLTPLPNGLGKEFFTNKNAMVFNSDSMPYLTNPNYNATINDNDTKGQSADENN